MITPTERGCRLSLFIQPNASKNEIIGLHNGALKIKISAPPIEGRANEELIAFLAKTLKIPKRQVEVLKGETGRNKIVEIIGVNETELKTLLKI